MRKQKVAAIVFLAVVTVVTVISLVNEFISFYPPLKISSMLSGSSNNVSSCGFFAEKYCDDVEIKTTTVGNREVTIVGAKLPVGAEITTPFDATAIWGTLSGFEWEGSFIGLTKSENPTENVRLVGDLEGIKFNDWSATKGTVVGIVKGDGITNIDGYNVIIMFSKQVSELEFEDNQSMLKEYY